VIFVSIAAYRDPEIIPTVQDLFAKAAKADEVRVVVGWQHGPEDPELPFRDDPRVTVLDINWRDSEGVCWARAQIQTQYASEDWYLQLDSHMRFVQDWDRKLTEQAERTGSPRPILTGWPGGYDPDTPPVVGAAPHSVHFSHFDHGIMDFRAHPIVDWRDREDPVRGRFLIGCFIFAPGSFVQEVPYDPTIYYRGEEVSLSVRAFTHGFDIFHPTEVIVWHWGDRRITRPSLPSHWLDHVPERGVAMPWYERDRLSREYVKRFFEDPQVGAFGCGPARTVAAYEAFAGVSFRNFCVSDYCRNGGEPPDPTPLHEWLTRIEHHAIMIRIEKAALPFTAETVADWSLAVQFFDDADKPLYQHNVRLAELRDLLGQSATFIEMQRECASEHAPVSWTVSPHHRTRGHDSPLMHGTYSWMRTPTAWRGVCAAPTAHGVIFRTPESVAARREPQEAMV
jgi:hypothetical protein